MATLEQLKRHLRIEDDEPYFDAELTELLDAARNHLESLDVDLSDPIAPALSHAIVLLVGYWHHNGGGLIGEAPRPAAYGLDRLIAPFRRVAL